MGGVVVSMIHILFFPGPNLDSIQPQLKFTVDRQVTGTFVQMLDRCRILVSEIDFSSAEEFSSFLRSAFDSYSFRRPRFDVLWPAFRLTSDTSLRTILRAKNVLSFSEPVLCPTVMASPNFPFTGENFP